MNELINKLNKHKMINIIIIACALTGVVQCDEQHDDEWAGRGDAARTTEHDEIEQHVQLQDI
jgi:hypothetical protein